MLITSEVETLALAKKIATKLNGGEIVTLSGDLGTGKTTFTKGLAKALGITQTITSPTFAIMNVYELPEPINEIKTLVHIDAYRLESPAEIITVGAEDYLGEPDTLCVIEWPQKIQAVLDNYETIDLKFSISGADRIISGQLI